MSSRQRLDMLPTLNRSSSIWRHISHGYRPLPSAASCFPICLRTAGCSIATALAAAPITLLFPSCSTFAFCEAPPKPDFMISVAQWQEWGCRLRPFLLPSNVRDLYREFAAPPDSIRLGTVARVGIGYVTGANDFFHLRPSEAERAGIPDRYLHPSVRNGRCLAGNAINNSTVDAWRRRDEAILLLRLDRSHRLPQSVQRYLDSAAGKSARETYKCRTRDPWYVVPDVNIPHAFLSYMCGVAPSLVANRANCVGTNSVHVVRLNGKMAISEMQDRWRTPLTQLSCELEGHPLGGGMLKLEPREAGKVVLGRLASLQKSQAAQIAEGLEIMSQMETLWPEYPPFANGLTSSRLLPRLSRMSPAIKGRAT